MRGLVISPDLGEVPVRAEGVFFLYNPTQETHTTGCIEKTVFISYRRKQKSALSK